MNKNKLAIITVNYNNYKVTEEFLNGFDNQDDKYKIFISDLSDKKQKIDLHSNVELINSKNRGYAHGVNIAIKQALYEGFEKFAVINSDTRVNSDFPDRVINILLKKTASLIGGKIYYEKGYEYHKDRYLNSDLGKIIWYAGGICDWKNAYTKHRGVDEIDKGKYNKFEKTDFITGCFMAFDKKVVEKIGYWDESYFLYYEDADYCERAKKNKINLYYDPSIVIWHKNAQSTGGAGSNLHIKYQNTSRFKFGMKYAPIKTKIHLVWNYLAR